MLHLLPLLSLSRFLSLSLSLPFFHFTSRAPVPSLPALTPHTLTHPHAQTAHETHFFDFPLRTSTQNISEFCCKFPFLYIYHMHRASSLINMRFPFRTHHMDTLQKKRRKERSQVSSPSGPAATPHSVKDVSARQWNLVTLSLSVSPPVSRQEERSDSAALPISNCQLNDPPSPPSSSFNSHSRN